MVSMHGGGRIICGVSGHPSSLVVVIFVCGGSGMSSVVWRKGWIFDYRRMVSPILQLVTLLVGSTLVELQNCSH